MTASSGRDSRTHCFVSTVCFSTFLFFFCCCFFLKTQKNTWSIAVSEQGIIGWHSLFYSITSTLFRKCAYTACSHIILNMQFVLLPWLGLKLELGCTLHLCSCGREWRMYDVRHFEWMSFLPQTQRVNLLLSIHKLWCSRWRNNMRLSKDKNVFSMCWPLAPLS